jgi:hypothetical protein
MQEHAETQIHKLLLQFQELPSKTNGATREDFSPNQLTPRIVRETLARRPELNTTLEC